MCILEQQELKQHNESLVLKGHNSQYPNPMALKHRWSHAPSSTGNMDSQQIQMRLWREFGGEFSNLIRSETTTKGLCHAHSRHDLVCYYTFIWFHSEQPCFTTTDSTVLHSLASFLPRQILQEINLTHLLP